MKSASQIVLPAVASTSLALLCTLPIGSVLGTEQAEYARADMIYQLALPMDDSSRMEMGSDAIMKFQYGAGAKHPSVARVPTRYMAALQKHGDKARLEDAKKQFGVC